MPMPVRLLPVLAAVLLVFTAGTSKKPDLTVRFHAEANERDSDRFAQPVTLRFPPRQAFIERVPSLNERHVRAIYPFQAADGSWGCAFQLDGSGRLNLEVLSTERRGRSLVVFVGTKGGTHQVIDMLIDRRITDGIITVQRGLTELEVQALRKKFPAITAAPKPAAGA